MKWTIVLFILFYSSLNFGQWTEIKYDRHNINVYLPDGAVKTKSLMINLHGCAQKATSVVSHGNWQAAAKRFNTIVALPNVPYGGVLAGCWNYYGLNHTQDNKHNGFVLGLVKFLQKKYNISPSKTYLSGFSSGGGLSLILACLRPDLFAGIAVAAGPSIGSSAQDVMGAKLSVEQIKENCYKLADQRAASLKSLVASFFYDHEEPFVDPEYNVLNFKVFGEILETDEQKNFDLKALSGANKKGVGKLLYRGSVELVSLINNHDVGHNWPAGNGGNTLDFINPESIDYPLYLLEFLTTKNQRL